MAEPLILAYGRGELPEFPAAADTIVDIVPVDHVVAAIVAVLAHPPEPGDAGVLPRLVGHRNPLTFRTLYDNVRAYFDEHPFTAGDRGAVPAARLAVPRRAGRGAAAHHERARPQGRRLARSGRAPRSDRTRDLARKLDQQGRRLEFLRRYLDLYREYAQAELRFSDDRHPGAVPLAVRGRPRRRSPSTPRSSTGGHYLQDVHCPAVTAPIRSLDELRAAREARPHRRAQARGSTRRAPAGSRRSSTWTARCCRPTSSRPTCGCGCASSPTSERFAELGRIAARVPSLVRAERRRAQRLPAHRLPRVRRRPARPTSTRSPTRT